MLSFEYELRPPAACRLTKLGGRPMLGFNALSDGAVVLRDGKVSLLSESGAGWPEKRLPGPDVHLLALLDDLTSVMAIQTRHHPIPEILGAGSAGELLRQYDRLVAAADEALDEPPGDVLDAGDYLVARSLYLPGDTRLLVLDRGATMELACEGQELALERALFMEIVRGAAERFFVEMRARTEQVAHLKGREGYLSPEELQRQGAQWQRRIEALLRRSAGEKFAPLLWPW